MILDLLLFLVQGLPLTNEVGNVLGHGMSLNKDAPPPFCPPLPNMGPHLAWTPLHGGHHWRPVQTCSLQDPPPPPPLVLTFGGY